MKTGYRTPGFGNLTFEEKLQFGREVGLTTIEVAPREFEDERPEDVGALADEMDMEITAVAVGMDLCRPEVYEEALEICRESIDLCHGLGIDYMFTRSMWPEPGVHQQATWNHLVPAMRQVCRICADSGVRLGFETDHGCFIDTLERLERLIEGVDHENLYINYDPTNFYVGGSDPLAVLDRWADRIPNGHIKDGVYQYERREETAIGEGEVPYQDIYAKMDDLGLDFPMNIEHVSQKQQVRDAADYVFEILDDLGIEHD